MSRSVTEMVLALVDYAEDRDLIDPEERTYTANLLLDALRLEADETFHPSRRASAPSEVPPLEEILKVLLDDAVERKLIDGGIASRDLFDTRLMSCVTPRPGQVQQEFWSRYDVSPKAATDWFYQLSKDSDYIRTYRIARDRKWQTDTPYGLLDITINLSKPEKDPRAIAAALNARQDAYPQCLLCRENEGYAGRLDHPARQTIRLIPLILAGERWYLQYSPYVYYQEHCIVLKEEHVPMRIDRTTFERLLEFCELFPHYTIGSNADLPIVGGSILTHEHYQGGNYTFAMARAGIRQRVAFEGFEDVSAGIVEWPMSVVRLDGTDPERLVELADQILTTWRTYTDETVGVSAESDGVPHNTITPIARRCGRHFELDLVLRNNRTSAEHPLGIFHPHAELHHIKRENIGLIEVMGLAILPARLLGEVDLLEKTIAAGVDPDSVPELAAHAQWAHDIIGRHPELAADRVDAVSASTLHAIIQEEMGLAFARVLEHCAVFANDDEGARAFARFLDCVRSGL